MGKLRTFSGQALCKILSGYGFKEVRRRGSHILMQKVHEASTLTVPVPNHKEIRTGTLQAIIRQSGLPRSKFEA